MKNESTQKEKSTKRFLGIHFDFHAVETDSNIGSATTEDMIEEMLEIVKPDFVQCDCKGHPGYSSYPTEVGCAAPGVTKDALRVWRAATEKHGVALFMHYSGVFDKKAVQDNPQWARIDENGIPDTQYTSVFGEYVDKRLVPQLIELAQKYNIDGAWVDGDCWGAQRDYSPLVLKEFSEETGITKIPYHEGDPSYFAFSEFCREGFRKYLRHYVDRVHEAAPAFRIASNWAFSSYMPDKVSANVDFLSGDYTLHNSVNSARFEGRCLLEQGKPWDLMAWAFNFDFPDELSPKSIKTGTQLCQEAAIVMSLGGGFQAYFQQNRDGSINNWQMKAMKQAADFCREREVYCYGAKPVPQIALLYSTAAFYRCNKNLFGAMYNELTPLRGVLQALLDTQNSVEIVMEHHLVGRMDEYPLIVIPEWKYLGESFKQELLRYVEKGGNLLLIGPYTAKLFQDELGVMPTAEVLEHTPQWIAQDDFLCGVGSGAWQSVRVRDDVSVFGTFYANNDLNEPTTPSASITCFGKGKIAATYFNMGAFYENSATTVMRDYLNALVHSLFQNPIVRVSGSHLVDVMVSTLDDKLQVHLVNTAGPHANLRVYTYDEIPPVGPITVQIRCETKPHSIKSMPKNIPLMFTYENGIATVFIERIELYDILIIE